MWMLPLVANWRPGVIGARWHAPTAARRSRASMIGRSSLSPEDGVQHALIRREDGDLVSSQRMLGWEKAKHAAVGTDADRASQPSVATKSVSSDCQRRLRRDFVRCERSFRPRGAVRVAQGVDACRSSTGKVDGTIGADLWRILEGLANRCRRHPRDQYKAVPLLSRAKTWPIRRRNMRPIAAGVERQQAAQQLAADAAGRAPRPGYRLTLLKRSK